jgi:hypothetical protein
MWNNGFSEKRPELACTSRVRATSYSYSYSRSCSKRGLAIEESTTVAGS